LRRIGDDSPCGADLVKALKVDPERLRTGFAIAFWLQETAQTCYAAYSIAQGWRLFGYNGIPVGKYHQSVSLRLVKIHSTYKALAVTDVISSLEGGKSDCDLATFDLASGTEQFAPTR